MRRGGAAFPPNRATTPRLFGSARLAGGPGDTVVSILNTFKLAQMRVGQVGLAVQVPGVYPPGFIASITGGPICGDGHVAFGVPSGQFGTVSTSISFPVTTVGGVPSAAAFGTPTAKAVFRQTLTGLGTAQSFGSPSTRAVVTVALSGLGSAQAFGVLTLKATRTVALGSLTSAQAFGTSTILIGGVKASPGGVNSAQAFGRVSLRYQILGLGSAQSFGTISLRQTKTVAGLGSAQAFGAATTRSGFTKPIGGVPSAQAFGAITGRFVTRVSVPGVGSAQAFGTSRTRLNVSVPSVFSAQAFGTVSARISWLHDAPCLDEDLFPAGSLERELAALACLGNEDVPICGIPICGDGSICGGSLVYVRASDCLEPSPVEAVLNEFLLAGMRVGQQAVVYVSPSPPPFVLDLQPAGVT